MRVLHCVLILAFAILLKNVYCDSKVTSYILTVQWPPGVCTGKSGIKCEISPVPTEFTIHGLWPQFPAAYPPVTSNETFGNQLANLTTELNKNWPNLSSKQQQVSINLRFWGWEWNRHGKVSEMDVHEYFKKTLELFKGVGQGLKGKLAAQGISPSDYNTYELQHIEATLKRINGNFSCSIICVQRQTSRNAQQIKEIQFSFTTNFQKQDNGKRSPTCGTDVMYPLTG